MKQFFLYTSVLAILLCCSGCVTIGAIYTHVTTPLDTNMTKTRSGIKEANGSIKHIIIMNFSFIWDNADIGSIAKKNGIETIYYTDLESLHIFGVFHKYYLHIYGI